MGEAYFAAHISSAWYEHIDRGLKHATGRARVALLASLMQRCGVGGRDWLSQFPDYIWVAR